VLTRPCGGPSRSLGPPLIADGARWIRTFFTQVLAAQQATMILELWHPRKKCTDLSSMICAGRATKRSFIALNGASGGMAPWPVKFVSQIRQLKSRTFSS
jgi:hypothetical protein